VTASRARELLLPPATAAVDAPRWLDDSAAATALSVLAASLNGGLREVEQELAAERVRHATDVEALRAAEAQAADLEQRLARTDAERRRLEADLAKVRATTWWRVHDRLLPVLRPLVGIGGR
jgi:hypothetical protein